MTKTKNKKSPVSHKKALLAILIISSFIMSALSLYFTTSYFSLQQIQAKNDSEAIWHLTTETAQLSYCIDHDIKPCTKENINKSAE